MIKEINKRQVNYIGRSLVNISLCRKFFLFLLLGICLGQEGYTQNIDWRNPLCIAEDTGMGGPRYFETNFPLNEVAPSQVFEFKLRCRADVESGLYIGGWGNGIYHFNVDLEQYQPLRKKYDITLTITNLGDGQQSTGYINVFAVRENYLNPIYFPALGEGRFHDISVKISLSEKILEAGTIPENPKPVRPLYLPLFSISEKGSTLPLSERYAPYVVNLVTTFDKFPDPCVTPGPLIIVPSQIDFGTLNREDLEGSVKNKFFFRVARLSEDTCTYNLYPIITFKATDPVLNDEIYLDNGTILSLEEIHSGFGKIKLNTPMRFGELKPKEFLNLLIEATLRKNPDKPLRGGAFSTVVIYHIELR